ncbi:ATP-binding protein [Cognatiyoonia sp.]|uniref:HAMP domain-containing sensor histidine kinase n=1 Tax=Cognatiyoonia sp. TaxID=2211652 RepID=UPI003F6A39F2
MNRLRSIWRLSALRQSVLLTVVFLILLVLAGGFSVFEFARVFDNRIEDELTARYTTVATDIEAGRFNAANYANSRFERIALLDDSLRLRNGFHDEDSIESSLRSDSFDGPGQWIYLVGDTSGGKLIIGSSIGRRNEFIEIIVQAMTFVGLMAAVLALLIGGVLGFLQQRRMSKITRTLETAKTGDLTTRIDVKRNRDDLDGLAHQVDETLAQLDVLMRQTRDFSANIAHDLKTPLARLRIRLETALTVEMEEGDSVEQIGAALEQADRVIAIFDAFLRIAKLEAGTAQAKFEPIDLGGLVQEVAEIYDAVVEDSGRTLSQKVTQPQTIQGDRVLLIQTLANLVENALRYTPKGSDITLFTEGAKLGVADTGAGIPDDEYDRITQPLYRLDKSRTDEGAGLGLALVKTIAAAHHARLSFSANPDAATKGLRVMLDFS